MWGCFASETRKTPPKTQATLQNPKEPNFKFSGCLIQIGVQRFLDIGGAQPAEGLGLNLADTFTSSHPFFGQLR